MKFFALVVALLLEQLRPLRRDNAVYGLFERYADSLERHFNGGQPHHGIVAWLLAVVPLVAATFAIHLFLYRASPVLAWAWSVAVLYLTLGFRQFSHYYTEIHEALQAGRLDEAQVRLQEWRGARADDEGGGSAIARAAIELGLIGAHRHVFGPVASFVILGPAGAVLYRATALLAQYWGQRSEPEFGAFGRFAEQFFFWLDWVPSRITAASFAIVGNFEDAVFYWRTQAPAWATHSQGVILASGAGAIGVRLGERLHVPGAAARQEVDGGDEADADHMQSAVGLIWRALVLWMFLLVLVTVAHSLG